MKSISLLFFYTFFISNSLFGQCEVLSGKGDSLFAIKKYSQAREMYLNTFKCDSSKVVNEKIIKCQELSKKEVVICDEGCGNMINKIVTVANKSFENKEYKKAMRYYARVLIIKPTDSLIYCKLIETLKFSYIDTSISFNTEYEIEIKKADFYLIEGCEIEAKECYMEAIKLGQNNPYPSEMIDLIIRFKL